MKYLKTIQPQVLFAEEKQQRESPQFSGPNRNIEVKLEENEQWIKEHFAKCSDLVMRKFSIGTTDALFCYFDGLIDKKLMSDDVLYRLSLVQSATMEEVKEKALAIGELKTTTYLNEIAKGILDGDAVLLIDGQNSGFVLGAKGWQMRSIDKAGIEGIVRGPNEAFTENLRTNTSMLRRRLHTDAFKMESRTIGTVTKTKIVLAYLEGTVRPQILEELQHRLDGMKEVDSILASGCIEQYLEDSPYSPFPQAQYTEKPDKAVAAMMEGRVVILVDGSPDGLIVPCVLAQFLQSSEDYYNRIVSGTFVRWVRYLGIGIAAFLPAIYIALTAYHPEMLPTDMALSIAAAREGIPFSAFGEAMLMEIAFELLREASIRMPGSVSSILGVVGALIIGQAAVEAQLVAPQMVIVIAITAIGSFIIPVYELSYSIRVVRFGLMIMAALFGLSGFTLGIAILLLHLIRLTSLGYPYLYPFAPFSLRGVGDILVRLPRWAILAKPIFRGPTEEAPRGVWRKNFREKERKP